MNKANKDKIRKDMSEIFYDCYSVDLSVCPKHAVFRPQLAITKLIAAGYHKKEVT